MDLNKTDLEVLFNKYNIVELNVFDIIFEYVHEYDIESMKEILDKVRKEKEINCFSDFEVPVKSNNFSLGKMSILSDKEVNFLHNLVEDASFYLSSIQSDVYAYEQVIEDFDIDEYPVMMMSELENSIYKEINNRKKSVRTYTFN